MTALQQGEVTGLNQEQNTKGEDGGIINKKDMTDSSCCMSGASAGLTRCTELECPVFPVRMWQGGTAAARSREEAEKEKKVVACWPLPPLGPVVLTTYKKGEVQGFRRKRVSTGDNKGTCIETKNLVHMKWIKQLHSVQRM